MAFYIYTDVNGFWRWYLESGNNKKIANSGEGYWNKNDCLHAIGLVMETTTKTPIYNLSKSTV